MKQQDRKFWNVNAGTWSLLFFWCRLLLIYLSISCIGGISDSYTQLLTHTRHAGLFLVTQTVVTSWANICHTLRQADDHWWETQNTMTPPPPPASWTDENEILVATATITKRKSPVSVPATGTNHPGSSSRVTFNTTTTTTHVPQPTKKFRPTLGQSESTSTTEEEEEVVVEEGEQCFATPMDDDDSVSLF